MESVTWDQVLAWRMRRQFIDPPGDASAVEVARRLAGLQAQVASAAELAVAVRRREPDPGAAARALADGALVKTWAMRGTLHLLPAAEAGAYLALCATVRPWEKPSWQRAFGATPADLEAVAEAAAGALAGGAVLTRAELTAEIVDRTGSAHLAEVLGSGWGTLLKPLAWRGVLCHGPAAGNRVTFASPAHRVPGWRGLPPVEEAAAVVIRAFLGAHGPAAPEGFDAWLSRGGSRRRELRGWFEALGDELTAVDVEGAPMYVRTEHLDDLLGTAPSTAVRMLGAFDPYVLGAGTGTAAVVPPDRRAEVSRKAGWISPVVLHGGRVVGTWEPGAAPALWSPPPADLLSAEQTRLAALL